MMLHKSSGADRTACGGSRTAPRTTARAPATAAPDVRMSDAQRRPDHRRACRQRIDARAMRARCANGARTAASSIIPATAASRDRDIQGHGHAARAQDAEQQQGELEAVVHEQRDARAAAQARGGQSVGDLCRLALELRPASAGAAPSMSAVRAPRHLPWRAIRSGSSGCGAANQLTAATSVRQ